MNVESPSTPPPKSSPEGDPLSQGPGSSASPATVWLLLGLGALVVFFFWGVRERIPWVLRILEWSATVF